MRAMSHNWWENTSGKTKVMIYVENHSEQAYRRYKKKNEAPSCIMWSCCQASELFQKFWVWSLGQREIIPYRLILKQVILQRMTASETVCILNNFHKISPSISRTLQTELILFLHFYPSESQQKWRGYPRKPSHEAGRDSCVLVR